jgi:hypothetical protein
VDNEHSQPASALSSEALLKRYDELNQALIHGAHQQARSLIVADPERPKCGVVDPDPELQAAIREVVGEINTRLRDGDRYLYDKASELLGVGFQGMPADDLVNQMLGGVAKTTPKRGKAKAAPLSGRKPSPGVAARRAIVAANLDKSATQLCQRFDFDGISLPEGYEGISRWKDALVDQRYKQRVWTLIAKDKACARGLRH